MTTENNALNQANAQANSIAAMVAAMNVDYDRLEDLRNEREELGSAITEANDNLDGTLENHDALIQAEQAICEWDNSIDGEELAQLEEDANGNTNEEEAREAIQNDALDVQVRSMTWHNPGDTDNSANEFMILLCTGGPAVRIMGELDDDMQPCRAWIEYQDWGTPWTQAFNVIEQDTLLAYCQQFYFGE